METIKVERVKPQSAVKYILYVTYDNDNETIGFVEYPTDPNSKSPVGYYPSVNAGRQERKLLDNLNPFIINNLLQSIGSEVFYFDATFSELESGPNPIDINLEGVSGDSPIGG